MFEIDDGLFLDPWAVVAVKSVGEGKCAVYLKGQSAVDGSFLVNKPALEAATDVMEARQEFDEQPGDEEPDNEDDEDNG